MQANNPSNQIQPDHSHGHPSQQQAIHTVDDTVPRTINDYMSKLTKADYGFPEECKSSSAIMSPRNAVDSNVQAFRQQMSSTPQDIPGYEYDFSCPPYNPLISPPVTAIYQHHLLSHQKDLTGYLHGQRDAHLTTDELLARWKNEADFRVALPDRADLFPPDCGLSPISFNYPEEFHTTNVNAHVPRTAPVRRRSSTFRTSLLRKPKATITRRQKPKPLTLIEHPTSTAQKTSSNKVSTTEVIDLTEDEILLIMFLALHLVNCSAIATEVHRSHACSAFGKCPCNHVKTYTVKVRNQIATIANLKGSEQDADQLLEKINQRAAIEGWDRILRRARDFESTACRAERQEIARDRVALKQYRISNGNQDPLPEESGRSSRAYRALLREAEDLEQAELDKEMDSKVLKDRLMELWLSGKIDGKSFGEAGINSGVASVANPAVTK